MRWIAWHRVAHAGIALVCLTRAFAYSDWLTPAIDSPGPIFLTDDGQWLWVYALLWLLVGVVALVDGVRRRTSWAIPLFIGIMVVWGLSYAGAWWMSDYTSPDWMTSALYIGTAAVVLGAHLIISIQEEEVSSLADSLRASVTGQLPEVDNARE